MISTRTMLASVPVAVGWRWGARADGTGGGYSAHRDDRIRRADYNRRA